MIELMKYLPDYYQESRVMKSIQMAIEGEIPDLLSVLPRIFFLSTCPDDFLWLWQNEYGSLEKDDIYAKIRGTGLLNREITESLGIELFEPYRLSPEEGYTLSGNDAVFPDGKYYAPLVTDVIVIPDKIEMTRKLINATKASGFNYWLAVKLSEIIKHKQEITTGITAVIPGVIFPSFDGTLSGVAINRSVGLTCIRQNTLVVPRASPTTAPTVAYDGLLLKFTDLGALDILRNTDDYAIEDRVFNEDDDAAELFAHIFGTGPATIPAQNKIWRGYSFKAIAPQTIAKEQNFINITAAVEPVRNDWSPAVSFLEPGITFLENNMQAQYCNIKVEVR